MVDRLMECLAIAGRQAGVVSVGQLQNAGMKRSRWRWLADTGRWKPVLPGVYRVVGAPETWHQQLRALNLWLKSDFALSHATAAALHRFPGFSEGPLVATAVHNRRAPEGVTIHRVQSLSTRDLASVTGLRVTTATRTLLDLAGELSEEHLRHCVNDALRFKWTTLDKLDANLDRLGARPGSGVVKTLIDEFRGGRGPTESELERRVLQVLDEANFPRPDQQRPIHVGGRLRRIDFSFTAHRLIIEADGYAYHSTVQVFEDDRRRNNALAARGLTVLHWTWTALIDRPDRLLAELASCLRRAA